MNEIEQSAHDPEIELEPQDWYLQHADALVRLAHGILGSPHAAQDVVHDAFVKVLRTRAVPDRPEQYLRTAVVNLCRDRMRREGVARRAAMQVPSSLHDPELDTTWQLLQTLPPKQRTCLALKFGEDLTERQISEITGFPLGTVKTSISRGLKRLRKELR